MMPSALGDPPQFPDTFEHTYDSDYDDQSTCGSSELDEQLMFSQREEHPPFISLTQSLTYTYEDDTNL